MDEQTQLPIGQQQQEPGTTTTWLPFGLTWQRAWTLSTIVMPLLCALSLIGLGMAIFGGFTALQYASAILAGWTLMIILLWMIAVLHFAIDVLVLRHWHNGDWGKVMNWYTTLLVVLGGLCLFVDLVLLTSPFLAEVGMNSFSLLLILGVLAFGDIWILHQMKEKEATRHDARS